jgi:hypothetical protein
MAEILQTLFGSLLDNKIISKRKKIEIQILLLGYLNDVNKEK